MREDAVAIVLAGGRSTRFGSPEGGKAAVMFAGETLLGRVCRVAAAEVPRVVVVAAVDQPLPTLPDGVEIVRDRTPAAGPLAALRDGLGHVAAGPGPPPRLAVLLSCDLPLVRSAVVRRLLDAVGRAGVQWAVPRVDGHPQVLTSAVRVDPVAGAIERALAAGVTSPRAVLEALARAGRGVVSEIDANAFRADDPALESFRDVDTPADLARLDPGRIPPSPG